jgi:hypothetical protein
MSDQLPPEPPDLTLLLPRSTYWQLVHELQSYLPPPIDDTPEARAHRDRAAIADVASMLPANAEEARIAARSVSADAQAAACIRQARKYEEDVAIFLKCNAQAASMIRLANSSRSLLARLQAARRKREADEAARNQDTWTEHAAVGLMADVVGHAAPAPPPPVPEPQEQRELQDSYSQLTEAEQYAITYPRRAADIRAYGGLPEPCRFGPPSPELVQAIVTGTSPILLELDKQRDRSTG